MLKYIIDDVLGLNGKFLLNKAHKTQSLFI